jgi:2-polyprenyl-3-methyl-5-hydroxy-6-metoxy-1,4-benzoquinol methylase
VLDLGCAEGLMLPPFLAAGASRVVGIDRSPRRIASARRLVRDVRAEFAVADLTTGALTASEGPLAAHYDFVLFLGVYQHLQPQRRRQVLRQALSRTRGCLVLRAPRRFHPEARAAAAEAGFAPLRLPSAGPVAFYAPVAAAG